jgi:hypothetical protein
MGPLALATGCRKLAVDSSSLHPWTSGVADKGHCATTRSSARELQDMFIARWHENPGTACQAGAAPERLGPGQAV